ncbi:hypothetical protein ACIRSS_23030 [Amycolatopsis sp. NPDC101161]|uniref:hypothetical protein n=1 Tax=Amycolatopsis sp. NPDC101161 TaxID=3363940 RepID=UPI003809BB20
MKKIAGSFVLVMAIWSIAKIVGWFLANLPRITAAAIRTLELLGLLGLGLAGVLAFLLARPVISDLRSRSKSKPRKHSKLKPGRGRRAANAPIRGRGGALDHSSSRPTPAINHHDNGDDQAVVPWSLSWYTLPPASPEPIISRDPEPPPVTLDCFTEIGIDRAGDGPEPHPLLALPEEFPEPDGSAELPCITIVVEPLAKLPAGLDGSTGNRSVWAGKVNALVIGDHNRVSATTERRIAIGTVSLPGLLARQPDLIGQFARALHDPAAEPAFNRSLSRTVDVMGVLRDPSFTANGAIRPVTRTRGGKVRLGEAIAVVDGVGTRAVSEFTAETNRTLMDGNLQDLREEVDLSPPPPPARPVKSDDIESVLWLANATPPRAMSETSMRINRSTSTTVFVCDPEVAEEPHVGTDKALRRGHHGHDRRSFPRRFPRAAQLGRGG